MSAKDKVRFDPRTDQQIHLYCKKTGKIIDYEDPVLKKMIAMHLKKRGIINIKINQIPININGETKPVKLNTINKKI